MTIHYNRKKLETILSDFYKATGVNISIVDASFSPIAGVSGARCKYCSTIQASPVGKCACLKSDMQLFQRCARSMTTEMQICHAGLMDIAVPIIHIDCILAYLIMGQIKTNYNFSEIEAYIEELALDKEVLRAEYNDIVSSTDEKLHAVANIAYMLTRYILTDNMMSADTNVSVDKAEQFIDNNFQNELTIREISKGSNTSKSVLYKSFRSRFHCTVKEYLNQKRIDKAIDLLINSDLSVEEIALQVGFSTPSYFSRVFKKQKGISPLKFRKIQMP